MVLRCVGSVGKHWFEITLVSGTCCRSGPDTSCKVDQTSLVHPSSSSLCFRFRPTQVRWCWTFSPITKNVRWKNSIYKSAQAQWIVKQLFTNVHLCQAAPEGRKLLDIELHNRMCGQGGPARGRRSHSFVVSSCVFFTHHIYGELCTDRWSVWSVSWSTSTDQHMSTSPRHVHLYQAVSSSYHPDVCVSLLTRR